MNYQRTQSQPRKYVPDHKCPATDLEYDPLLNYSAGLLGMSKARQDRTDTPPLPLEKICGGKCPQVPGEPKTLCLSNKNYNTSSRI